MDYYQEYINMSFCYSALFKEVNVDKLKWQLAGKKNQEGDGLAFCMNSSTLVHSWKLKGRQD